MRLPHTFETVELNSFRLPFCPQVNDGNCSFALHQRIVAGPVSHVKCCSRPGKDMKALTFTGLWRIMCFSNKVTIVLLERPVGRTLNKLSYC